MQGETKTQLETKADLLDVKLPSSGNLRKSISSNRKGVETVSGTGPQIQQRALFSEISCKTALGSFVKKK